MGKRAVSILAVTFIALSIFLSSSPVLSPLEILLNRFQVGEENLGSWKDEILSSNPEAEAPGPANDVSTLVLAENRTKRPDILSRFHKYRGGWDIANKHYWASGYTVQTLRNVTGYLTLAKTVNVAQIFLPSDVKDDIDRLNVDLNTAADTLEQNTNKNSSQIQKVFNTVAITDTCMAMGEWVEHPHAETALSNILPCVDQRTTNQTLFKSKQVINDIVNIVNGFVETVANSNPPPQAASIYYNQSGPFIPQLCYPYDSELQDRACSAQELSMENASLVWQNYTCTVSANGLCSSIGRLTPKIYTELVAAVNVSYALEHYAPPLLSLQNCNFVRDTFRSITSSYCPPLEHYLQTVNAGLALISVGVMLSLALWIMYANRPQREEVFACISSSIRGSCRGKKDSKTENNIVSADTGPRTGV
ncbi:hypothetical protein DH2020_043947 [Rehmannia glutinosa]|uniref:Uncharacterized protein n=1 Tax=Rehmannia glutinosa TaxID=99300 RepID=A0ABR0UII6_REHGL